MQSDNEGLRVKEKDAKNWEFLFTSRSSASEAFNRSCEMVLKNPRWVLDNLESLPTFRVPWEDYHRPGYWKERRKAKDL